MVVVTAIRDGTNGFENSRSFAFFFPTAISSGFKKAGYDLFYEGSSIGGEKFFSKYDPVSKRLSWYTNISGYVKAYQLNLKTTYFWIALG